MSARIGERQFAGAGGSTEFRDGVVLDIEVREAPGRHAAREWRPPKPDQESLVWMRTFVRKDALTGNWTTSLTG